MRCALIVGHKSTSPGAVNPRRGLTEFEFNTRLALDVWRHLRTTSIQPVLVFRRTYASLPRDVNYTNPLIAVSMHCNAYDHKTSGTEVLYYHRSKPAHKLAEIFRKHFVDNLPLRDRGIRAITREDRGGDLLARTDAPAVLCEPFFIDNDDDLEAAEAIDLAGVYASAIKEGINAI